MTPLRLAFLGTPDFAVPSLRALAEAGHAIAAVYCQPPRPAGRGHKPRPAPVQAYAEARGWAVRTPASLKDEAEQSAFAALELDAAVVAAYGLILPRPILEAPRLGCLNVHASLLPRWRGAAPIHRAILAGDRETGITIMQMDEGLDTGPIVLQEAVPIGAAATAETLHDELADLGARLIVRALDGLARGKLAGRPQPAEGVTYAAKLTRAEGVLDWRRPAAELERRVRALSPWPGAFLESEGERIKVLAAEVVDRPGGAPGTVLDAEFTVACGEGALRLARVQRAGKAATDGAAFLRGFRIAPGARLALSGAAP
jgi:methionyl-tRNA formyltransferase